MKIKWSLKNFALQNSYLEVGNHCMCVIMETKLRLNEGQNRKKNKLKSGVTDSAGFSHADDTNSAYD